RLDVRGCRHSRSGGPLLRNSSESPQEDRTNLLARADSPAEEEGCERLVPMRKTTHEAPSLLCRSPQDHMKISLDLKRFVRGLDPPMPASRLPAEQQPDVMPCILSLPSGP